MIAMPPLQRHDLLFLTTEGRDRLCRDLRASDAPFAERMSEMFGAMRIPVIVRRRAPCDRAGIGVGISFPHRERDQRLRFAAAVTASEVTDVLSPYAIVEATSDESLPPLRVLRSVKTLGLTQPGNLGVYGASALQVITGMGYLHERSDLDLIIRRESMDSLQRLNRELSSLEREMGVVCDVEVTLGCGGEVKLRELCSQQKTVLIKSIASVEIINKQEVMASLPAA